MGLSSPSGSPVSVAATDSVTSEALEATPSATALAVDEKDAEPPEPAEDDTCSSYSWVSSPSLLASGAACAASPWANLRCKGRIVAHGLLNWRNEEVRDVIDRWLIVSGVDGMEHARKATRRRQNLRRECQD